MRIEKKLNTSNEYIMTMMMISNYYSELTKYYINEQTNRSLDN